MNSIAGKVDFGWMQVDGALLSSATTINLKSGHAARAPNDGYQRLVVYDHGNFPGNPLEAYWQGAAEIFSYTDAPDTGSDQLTNVTRGVVGSAVNFTDSGGDYRIVSALELSDIDSIDRVLGFVVTSPRYGADPTGVADSTTAIQAAINAAEAASPVGTVFVPRGTYDISSTIRCGANIIAEEGAVFQWTGSAAGIVLDLRNSTATASVNYKNFILPTITSGVGLGGSDHIGVNLQNFQYSTVRLRNITGFYNALRMFSNTSNVISPIVEGGFLQNYKVGLDIVPNASEVFLGPQFRNIRLSTAGITALEAGSRGIRASNLRSAIFSCLWLRDGTDPEKLIELNSGCIFNRFDNCAYDSGTTIGLGGPTTYGNVFDGGQDLGACSFNESGGAVDNERRYRDATDGTTIEATGDLHIGTTDNAGNLEFFVGGSSVPTIRCTTTSERPFFHAPSSIAADGDLENSEISFAIDETNHELDVKAKYSGGTVKTGVVSLSGATKAYGEISADGVTSTTTCTTQNVWYPITPFDANGISSGTTPDQANDKITIDTAGDYEVTCNLHAYGALNKFEFVISVDGTEQLNTVGGHEFQTNATKPVSVAFGGLLTLAATDEITAEVRCTDAASKTVTILDANLRVVKIG